MTWPDNKQVGGQAFLVLGSPRNTLYEHQGIFLVRNELTKESQRSLLSLKIQETSMSEQAPTSPDQLPEGSRRQLEGGNNN